MSSPDHKVPNLAVKLSEQKSKKFLWNSVRENSFLGKHANINRSYLHLILAETCIKVGKEKK
jgi:hypothetical protein